MIKKRLYVFILISLSSLITLVVSISSSSSRLIVFCDVGQGTATLLQIGMHQVLVDTGPDSRVLSCIGRHIPFFDHTIETIIISHNQKDHCGGLAAIMEKYSVQKVFAPPPRLSDIPPDEFIAVEDGILLHLEAIEISILKASLSSKNINDSANVVSIITPHQTIFLSSDINGRELKALLPSSTSILQVPHHGSKYGLYPDSLSLALPSLAVISVGKKNTYGHPAKEVLDILKAKNISLWRTDVNGELVVNLK